MNYLSFFELNQEPFSNAPVSQYYFGSQQHGRALIRLMHAIEAMKGLAVLVGDIGAGKTTTARRLLESLPEEQYEAALLVMVQAGVSPQWLLTKIAYQLGVAQPSEDKTRLLGQLYRRLYAIHESGRKAVVLVDEAQMLNTRELMSEVRGLLNMEIPDQKLLTILFFGLPELEDNLKLDPPLYQRIAIRCRLDPLTMESTEAYIKHRLRLSGARRMLFTQEAVQAIHRASSGIPRLINTICDNALFDGFLSRTNPITARIIDRVVNELGYDGVTERGGFRSGPPSPFAGFAEDTGHRPRALNPAGDPGFGAFRAAGHGRGGGMRGASVQGSGESHADPALDRGQESPGSASSFYRAGTTQDMGGDSKKSAASSLDDINAVLAALENK